MDDQGSQGSQSSQGSQASQGSESPQQSNSHTTYSHEPGYRADVDPKALQKRPRKFVPDGKKLRKKNAQGILQYTVSIVSARYDDGRHSWMYTLNDWRNGRIAGETPERELG